MTVGAVLSDATIRELHDSGSITITPWDPTMVQPASYDVRLGNTFRVFPQPPRRLDRPAQPAAEPHRGRGDQ